MNEEVKVLSKVLGALRVKLETTPRTDPGFGEMRLMYRLLTDALIDAGDRSDREIADRIAMVAEDIAEEWASNKDKLAKWSGILNRVVAAVDGVLTVSKLSNPLTALLS